MENIQAIENNSTYKEVLKDSFGGVMYDVSNEGKYDTQELKKIVESMTPVEKESMNGIMKGALDFLKI